MIDYGASPDSAVKPAALMQNPSKLCKDVLVNTK